METNIIVDHVEYPTREELVSLLNQDSFYRRNKKWPLLTDEEISCFYSNTVYRNMGSRKPKDYLMFNVDSYLFRRWEAGQSPIINGKVTMEEYPLVNDLLQKFSGKLLAAGGAVFNAIHGRKTETDIDFFFTGIKEKELNKTLENVLTYLTYQWMNHGRKEFHNHEIPKRYVYITRNQYVVTVYLGYSLETFNPLYSYNNEIKYQFILRSYPRPDMVLGGFDISACMVGYDGFSFLATPLGMWSACTKINIVDTTRRSTSYEYRLVKYNKYGCRIALPGLSFDYSRVGIVPEYIMIEQVRNLIKKLGYSFRSEARFSKSIQKNPMLFVSTIRSRAQIHSWYSDKEGDYVYIEKLSYKHDISEKALKKVSDYYDNDIWPTRIGECNMTRLRCNNTKAVVSVICIESTNESVIRNEIIKSFQEPSLGIDIEEYRRKVAFFQTPDGHKGSYQHIKLFAEYTPKVKMDPTIIPDVEQVMIERMLNKEKIILDELRGIKWETKNPTKQWTSSINPIVKDPRDWYGDQYIPVLTGIPEEVETQIRLFRLKNKSIKREFNWFQKLPKDMLKMIIWWLAKAYTDDTWNFL